MNEAKKTRGAWEVRVRGTEAEQGTDTGISRLTPTISEDFSHCSKHKNTTDGREE